MLRARAKWMIYYYSESRIVTCVVNWVRDLQERVDHEWSERHAQFSSRSEPVKELVYYRTRYVE
jgi:hypothetical protein